MAQTGNINIRFDGIRSEIDRENQITSQFGYFFHIYSQLMLQTHFHEVDGDLFDHNIFKMFGLSKILTMIWLHRALIVI